MIHESRFNDRCILRAVSGNPGVTVAIPVINGERFIEDALASVERQTLPGIQIIVSNNCSTDRTAEILATRAQKLPISVFTQSAVVPMWPHINSLLDRVKTPYLMLLHHDDYFNAPDALERAAEILDFHPEVSAVYCDLAYVSAIGKPLMTRRFKRSGILPADDIGRQCLSTTRNMFGIPLMIRTSALGSQRYDERMSYIGDLDLSWRISKGGLIYHIPEPLIANRYHGANTTWLVLAQSERQFRLYAKVHGIPLSVISRLRLKWTNWFVAQQRKAFGWYAR